MLWIPQSFDDMPHTVEMLDVIKTSKLDCIPVEDFFDFLRKAATFGVYDKGEFCGFFLELFKGDHVEIHCFIYPSKRRVSIKLMHSIYESVTARGLYIETTIFSTHSHIAKLMEYRNFKEIGREIGYGTVGGVPIDLIYVSNKGD